MEEKRTIETLIKHNGVQFLSSGKQTQTIRVRLTKQGVALYHRLLHLRPMFADRHQKGDAWIYEFDCLPWQIEIYFFKFGQDAIVLEPSALAQRLREKYLRALDSYQ